MKRFWVVAVLSALALTGCGDSGLNPFGWFGGQSEEDGETLSDFTITEVRDPRPRIATVTALTIDRTPGGAIIRATGLSPEQGWHSADLVPVEDGAPAVLTFDFRAVQPEGPTRVSTVQSREIVVGYPISDIALQDVRTIRVVAASNIVAVRR